MFNAVLHPLPCHSANLAGLPGQAPKYVMILTANLSKVKGITKKRTVITYENLDKRKMRNTVLLGKKIVL